MNFFRGDCKFDASWNEALENEKNLKKFTFFNLNLQKIKLIHVVGLESTVNSKSAYKIYMQKNVLNIRKQNCLKFIAFFTLFLKVK